MFNNQGSKMSTLITKFIYKDSKGNITTRSISKISEQGIYLQGICYSKNKPRTFRKDRIIEMLDNPYEVRLTSISLGKSNPTIKQVSNDELDVCFTGFKSEDKNRLTKLAESKGMIIRKSVTVGLAFLCFGYNAGPSKCNKAREQGVIALNENEFVSLLETGEIPNS